MQQIVLMPFLYVARGLCKDKSSKRLPLKTEVFAIDEKITRYSYYCSFSFPTEM